jgi:formylmethanofuran dehydrogenase subunit C
MRYKTNLYIKIGAGAIAVIIVMGYAYLKVENLWRGPQVFISSPQNGTTVNNSDVIVSGYTKNTTGLSLNDNNIFVDESGNFEETLLVSYGYNIWELRAEDKFGREVTKTLEIVYK